MVEAVTEKKIKSVEDFEVYQKAKAVFSDFIKIDMPLLQKSMAGRTLLQNQLRCLDSICANMEEGYERKNGKEIMNFFRMAKGSSAEALGRYKRLSGILPEPIIVNRVKILGEIRAMLFSLISKWK